MGHASYADECTRAYAPRGKMAHLLPGTPQSGKYASTLCLRYPRPGASWLGTGSQDEYDKAAALPLCGKCDAAAKGAAT